MHIGEIVQSVMKSRFYAISSDFNDFTRFQPDFTHFRFFQTIQHAKHVLTRKIVLFYETKRDFNNLAGDYHNPFLVMMLVRGNCRVYIQSEPLRLLVETKLMGSFIDFEYTDSINKQECS
jgi:hypothetical protein